MPSVPIASGALDTQSGSLSLRFWESARFAGSYFVWGLMISLMGVAACYCCGCGAYIAYLRRHPPTRQRRGPDAALLAEVDRGVGEIEAYLATLTPRD